MLSDERLTITLDDELAERAARAIATQEGCYAGWWDICVSTGAEGPLAAYRNMARAAITAYLQGAVDAGQAKIITEPNDHTAIRNMVFLDSYPAIILPLPPQNASSAESSSISE
jgi:hypothetical protein